MTARKQKRVYTWLDGGDWTPQEIPFTGDPGPKGAAAALDSDDPVDFVELFLTDDLLHHIVEQTNLYAEQTIEANRANMKPWSRMHQWGEDGVCLVVMKNFLG